MPEIKTFLPDFYFFPRDFEIVQPIYDLAFLLKLKSTAERSKEPAYRVFSLNKAAHSLDGYSSSLSRWIEGKLSDDYLDYVPTTRIRNQLVKIKESGTIQELQDLMSPQAEGCLRLRSIRGLGPAQIAKFLGQESEPPLDLLTSSAKKCGMSISDIMGIFQGRYARKWQAAHIVPPLLRLLKSIENLAKRNLGWHLIGITDGISIIEDGFKVHMEYGDHGLSTFIESIEKEPFFHLKGRKGSSLIVQHQMGWYFEIDSKTREANGRSLEMLALELDPLIREIPSFIRSDLHTHTSWSDGAATPDAMTEAATKAGLEYIAVTDHSRSSKLQRGLTPSVWLRQAMSLYTLRSQHKVLHGMEVDILDDGNLDMPDGILCGMDLIVASIHSSWGGNREQNTARILSAIETGHVDIIGHPSTALMGRPGSPSYVRPPIAVDWNEVFARCSKWQVALEINCFPSRLDISSELLNQAIEAGCWISLGSDAHSRIHQDLLKFGIAVIEGKNNAKILNSLNFKEIKLWIKQAREVRQHLTKTTRPLIQGEMFGETIPSVKTRSVLLARYDGRPKIPQGSVVVGVDLTAGKNRKTAVAKLSGSFVETASLRTDEEILDYIKEVQPAIVSIDSPLGVPGGGEKIDPKAGIMRIAERDLASVGIPAYPALIGSMKELTLRGIRLRKAIESFDDPPTVIESYPDAAQDLLAIPRKQRGLNLLLRGLTEMGLRGPGLLTKSHDELDAITSAIVGRFFEVGQYEPMVTCPPKPDPHVKLE
jgi:histidinol phosphatase-like PHP family hydrolase/predicted nuclease with RNAse H fold